MSCSEVVFLSLSQRNVADWLREPAMVEPVSLSRYCYRRGGHGKRQVLSSGSFKRTLRRMAHKNAALTAVKSVLRRPFVSEGRRGPPATFRYSVGPPTVPFLCGARRERPPPMHEAGEPMPRPPGSTPTTRRDLHSARNGIPPFQRLSNLSEYNKEACHPTKMERFR